MAKGNIGHSPGSHPNVLPLSQKAKSERFSPLRRSLGQKSTRAIVATTYPL
jgi:hypothetical protein